MRITTEQVRYVAALSKLKLNEKEQQRMIEDMASIIAFADQLNELETGEIKPTAQTLGLFNVFREDESAPLYEREVMLANAPEKDDGCYLVPKLIE